MEVPDHNESCNRALSEYVKKVCKYINNKWSFSPYWTEAPIDHFHRISNISLILSAINSGLIFIRSMFPYAKEPCLTQIVCIPSSPAGSISLSNLSPTIYASSGLHPADFIASLNISGLGFSNPTSAEAIITSKK